MKIPYSVFQQTVHLTLDQKKLIEYVKSKIDKDAVMEDFLSLFRGWTLVKTPDIYGQYHYDISTIYLSSKANNLEQYDIFFHEFGHLIHEACDKTDFYNHYSRFNLRFSQILRSEQQASLIGVEFWKLKFPNVPFVTPPAYSNKKDVLFMIR